jgi:UDP-arabinose 4-epimerase
MHIVANMRRNVLVTGGAGYIGSHTCKALARANYQPITYDNLSEGHGWAVKWGPLVCGELSDRKLLRDTLEEFGIQAVLHFAACAYVGESVLHPRKYFQNNLANSLALLETMLDAGVRTIVFSSSCATYGVPDELPVAEEHPQNPINPYGASKRFVEDVLRWYGEAYGLGSATLRYFNAAGADPEGDIGESHDPETHLIPIVIAAAQGALPHVQILGTDYGTPDGTAVRDYVHVSDLADAHVSALDALIEGAPSMRLNLGTGRGHSIREVIAAVGEVSGRPIPVIEAPRRNGDPAALVAAPGRAQAVLGWKPRRSDLSAIVETAWRWHERSRMHMRETPRGRELMR